MKVSRDLLAVTRVDAFAEWAISQGYTREDPKGEWERLRLRKGSECCVYFGRVSTHRGGPIVHLSCGSDAAYRLVRKWLSARKQASRPTQTNPREDRRVNRRLQNAIDRADDADLPDGAYWAMIEEESGCDAADVAEYMEGLL